MVCAETSNRRARSSTVTRPEARAILRMSAWREDSSAIAHLIDNGIDGDAVPARGQLGICGGVRLTPPVVKSRPYTAVLRCRIGEPKVRLAAASMMVLVSRP